MMQSVLDYLYECFYSARILAGTFMFAHFLLERRLRHVWVSAVICAATTAAAALFNPLVKALSGNIAYDYLVVIHGLWYSGLLLVFFGILAANYKGRFGEYVYVFACGLLVECSTFGLFRLFYDFGVVELRVNTIFSECLELAFSSAIYVAAFFAFRAIFRRHGKPNPSGNIMLTVYFLLVIALIMFLRFNLQGVYEDVYGTDSGWIISLTLGMIPVALLALVTGAVHIRQLSDEKQVLAGMLSERERQYELSARNIEIINRKCHDIRRHLRALEFTDEEGRAKAIADMEKSVSIYDSETLTDNPALNTVLSEKRLYCSEHGISLTCAASGISLSFMTPADIYILFGNILDNAIEAVSRLEKEKRIITLTATERGGVICIREDNWYDGNLRFSDGLPATTKTDEPGYHGYGVKSIRHIAEKYGGSLNIDTEGNIFRLLVILPSGEKV